MNGNQNNSADVRNGGPAQCFSKPVKSAESNSPEEKNRLRLVHTDCSNKDIDKASEAERAALRELLVPMRKRQSKQPCETADGELPPAA